VAYDVEGAARAVISAGLPEEFAAFLRTGGAPVGSDHRSATVSGRR
jgi:hypothetical protein